MYRETPIEFFYLIYHIKLKSNIYANYLVNYSGLAQKLNTLTYIEVFFQFGF